MNMKERTMERIRVGKIQYTDLAEGAGVSRTWVQKFMSGDIPNPSITMLDKVNAYIDKHVADQVALQG